MLYHFPDGDSMDKKRKKEEEEAIFWIVYRIVTPQRPGTCYNHCGNTENTGPLGPVPDER